MNPTSPTAASRKNWAWVTTDLEISSDDWKRRFDRWRIAGIDAILPQIFNSRQAYYASNHLPEGPHWLEQILPLAKEAGLEFHAWMWSMPYNADDLPAEHPEWFIVNRKGESAADKPAYVDYYRFLCPSRPEVQALLQRRVTELAQYSQLDGIHLDYIRLPDVILAAALQPKYGIVQDQEYPQYDYCYCEVCRANFKAQTGTDPLDLPDPVASPAWRQFRYDLITHIVNDLLVPIAHQHDKVITAAVFPNWEMVRQQWSVWHLDAVLPMLYHNFYNAGIDWIEQHTRKGVTALAGRLPLYSGLFVPALSPDELNEAVAAAKAGGANGISLFHAQAMTEEHWSKLRL